MIAKNDPNLCSGTEQRPARVIYESSSVGVCPICRRVISFKIDNGMARHYPPASLASNTPKVAMESDYEAAP